MRVSSIRWGVFWVGIGLLFLAINFEVIDNLVFPRLLSLWPVLLIAIGVELIFRKTKLYFLALLSPILIACAFIVAASYQTESGWDFDEFFQGWSWSYKGQSTYDLQLPADTTIDSLNFMLDCGATEFRISPDIDVLFSVKSDYINKSPYVSHYDRGRTEFVNFDYKDKPGLSFLNLGGSPMISDFRISDRLPVDMKLSTKGRRPDIDLSDIHLVALSLFLDSRETTLRLGSLVDSITVVIDGETKSLRIVMPPDMGFDFTGRPSDLREAFREDEVVEYADGIRSEGFTDARQKAFISLDVSPKSISIVRE